MANVSDLNVGLRRRLEDMGEGRTVLTATFAGGYLIDDRRLQAVASSNGLGADWLARARAARDEIRALEAGGGPDRLLVTFPPRTRRPTSILLASGLPTQGFHTIERTGSPRRGYDVRLAVPEGTASDKNDGADTGNHLVKAALIAGELHDSDAGQLIARAITHPMETDWDVLFDGLGIVTRNYLASRNPELVRHGKELDALLDELTYEERVYLNARLFNPETRRNPGNITWAHIDAEIVRFGADYLRLQAASTNILRVALEDQVRNTPSKDAKLFDRFLRSLNSPEGVTPPVEDTRDLLALSRLIQDVYPHMARQWRLELTVERLQAVFQPERLWRAGRLDHEVLDARLLVFRDLVYGNNLIRSQNNADAELMETRVEALMTGGYWRTRDTYSTRLLSSGYDQSQFPQYKTRQWVPGRSGVPNPEEVVHRSMPLREGYGVAQPGQRAPARSITILGAAPDGSGDVTWRRRPVGDLGAEVGVGTMEPVFARGTRRVPVVIIDEISPEEVDRDRRAFAEKLWPTGKGGDEEQALQAAFHRMLATIFLHFPEAEADALVRTLTGMSAEVSLSFGVDVDPRVVGLYVETVQQAAQEQDIDLGGDLGDLLDYLGDAETQSADHVEAGSVQMASMRQQALRRMIEKVRI